MATTVLNRRIIDMPNAQSGRGESVLTDVMNAVRPFGPIVSTSQDGTLIRIDVLLTASQDAALVALMPGWASRLGIPLLNTHVTVGVTYGH